MKLSRFIECDDLRKKQEEFYNYFETGYQFEEFLKEYLIKMGLDEVELTKRSKDGGVDLKAIRKGVGDFSEIDKVNYYIQAKRYNLENKIGVKPIRELKGTIPFGYKGIFITTSFFTNDAKEEAENDPSKPVVLIDGEALMLSCISNQIGYVYSPVFSKNEMDKFLKYNSMSTKINEINYIDKIITINNIRARILSCPSSIMAKLEGKDEVTVVINSKDEYKFSINKGRNYFAKVTDFYRKFGMLSDENIMSQRKSRWYYNEALEKLFINLGEEDE